MSAKYVLKWNIPGESQIPPGSGFTGQGSPISKELAIAWETHFNKKATETIENAIENKSDKIEIKDMTFWIEQAISESQVQNKEDKGVNKLREETFAMLGLPENLSLQASNAGERNGEK